jgi:ABC-type branched-subunit amino acid transport system ATPase component
MVNDLHRQHGANRFGFEHAGVSQTRGSRTVLENLAVSLPDGQLVALIGPSGAGKTSLPGLLNRLDDPTSGEVPFRGDPLNAYPVRSIRRRVGFVFGTLAVIGIVSLPGMMTGQILARTDPTLAVRYQLASMLVATAAITSAGLVIWYRRTFLLAGGPVAAARAGINILANRRRNW